MSNNKKKAEIPLWIRKDTREALKRIGRKDEAYDDVVRRVLIEAGYEHILNEVSEA